MQRTSSSNQFQLDIRTLLTIQFRFLAVKNQIMKLANLLILLSYYFVDYSLANTQLTPGLCPRFVPGQHILEHAT